LYCINLNGNVTGTWVNKSTNNGQTWLGAVSGCTGNDRETMAADQTGGPYANYVYCGETQSSIASFFRSTDNGASFSNMNFNQSHNLPGFMMAVGPGPTGIQGGCVYAITSTGSAFSPTFTVYTSTDGGNSFALASFNPGWVNTVGNIVGGRNSYQNMRLRPYPFIYADNTYGTYRGRFYVFFCGNDPPGDGNKPDIYVRYSTDYGVTFSAPVTINDDPNSTLNAQFHPAAWCDRTTGRLLVHWMDTRNCPTADSAEIFASYSSNGGATWVANQKISTAKMRINCPSCGGGGTPAYQGDYNGMGSYNGIGVLSWTDFRQGNFGSYAAYYPDYAMKVNPATIASLGNNGDSAFIFVSVPAVKSYTGKVKFSATVTPAPANGTITLSFLNRTNASLQDTLTTYPDSVRLRISTSGNVTLQTYTVSIVARGKQGNIEQTPVHNRTVAITVVPIGIKPIGTEIPKTFYLYQNYPNPFNPQTNIRFDLAKAGHVKVTVFDVAGRQVTELVNGTYNAGKYITDFNAADYSSGIYFYKIVVDSFGETPDFVRVRKMIILK
jgi:hypothetical protein